MNFAGIAPSDCGNLGRVWTDAIELGLVALLDLRDANDRAAQEWLERLGVETWLATRLVTYLPFAARRRSGQAGAGVLPEADPIFRAAAARVGQLAHAEVVALAGRSREVARSFAPLGRGDGGCPEPRSYFAGFLEGHGHAPGPGPSTRQRVGDLELDAFVFGRLTPEGGYRPQVDFAVRHPRLAVEELRECFAGNGATYRACIEDAVQKFERGSVHVLIATLLDRGACADQVSWERWGSNEACLGAQLILYSRPGVVPIGGLVDALRDAFLREVSDNRVHALRVFTTRDADHVYADEVLLDGETWPTGLLLCGGYAWPRHAGAWGTRLFMMVRPLGGEA